MSIAEDKKKRARRVLHMVIVGIILAVTSLYMLRRVTAGEYRTITSPGGKYKIVVYRYPVLFSMPGGSGDAPGFVKLYDNRGRVLKEASVEMVQLVDQVNWEEDKVHIKFVAEWKLPR